jgi:hypothetical protein
VAQALRNTGPQAADRARQHVSGEARPSRGTPSAGSRRGSGSRDPSPPR